METKVLFWSRWDKRLRLAAILLVCTTAAAQPAPPAPQPVDTFTGHPRVAIISDIGNEPDDQMSFVRLLLYSNELDLEAMIASTSTWQKTATHAETMHALIRAYGQVRENLLLHAKGGQQPRTWISVSMRDSPRTAWAQQGREKNQLDHAP